MSKLSAIVPPRHRVTLQLADGETHEVDIQGISIPEITNMLARFPDMVAQFDGKLDAMALLKMGPEVVGAVLATACGAPGDKGAELALAALPLGTALELLDIVVGETMPNGVAPFVKLARRFGLDLATVRQSILSQTPSPKQSTSSSEQTTTSTE